MILVCGLVRLICGDIGVWSGETGFGVKNGVPVAVSKRLVSVLPN